MRDPRRVLTRRPLALVLLLLVLAGCSSGGGAPLPELRSEQRVYDQTGSSLTAEQARTVAARVEAVDRETGADTVVVVRELDASADDTVEQVEALQQAWIAATGASQEDAVAILVNRSPDDPTDARAGIFVGTRFDDGAVGGDRQEEIVTEALIPPLRDGDVAASVTAALDRFAADVRSGPAENPFAGAADTLGARTWLPWALLVVALAGAAYAARTWRARPRPVGDDPAPMRRRPDDLSPALGGALVAGRPQPSAAAALVLTMATRGAVAIEPALDDDGEPKDDAVTVVLYDGARVRGDLETVVHSALTERAEDGRVAGRSVSEVVKDHQALDRAVDGELRSRGWKDDAARRPRTLMGLGAGLALLLTIGTVVLLSTGAVVLLVGAVPLALLALGCFVGAVSYPQLTAAGLTAAAPWRAYRDGLKDAARDPAADVDLDTALPDIVATGIAGRWTTRLTEAGEDGRTLAAFQGAASALPVALWPAFYGSFVASSSGSGVASAGGATGGGAAGST